MGQAKPNSPTLFIPKITSTEFVLSTLIICLGFAVRLHNLGGDSFWSDEINTIRDASRGLASFNGNVTHPGLFFLITAAGKSVFGQSEFALRLSPMFWGTFSIALIIAAGRLLGRTSIGLWAGLLLALSQFHIRHSQEARMYPQLMALSLLSFILLYRALKKPNWSLWLAFSIVTALNIYTHYGGLIVLVSQSLFIGWWCIRALRDGRRKLLVYPMASALLVLLLFLPWVPRFLDSLQYNVGAEIVTHTGAREPLTNWMRVGYHDFAMYDEQFAMVFLSLCLLGLVLLAIRRRWFDVGWILSGLLLPLLFIYVFQVARGAIARYIIYELPLYLLAIAFAIATVLAQLERRVNRAAYVASMAAFVFVFVWLAMPKVRFEHERIASDWRGIVQYLDQNAEDGDVLHFISSNMSYNDVRASMPTYLQDASKSYLYYRDFRVDDTLDLRDIARQPWAIVNHWSETLDLENPEFDAKRFASSLFVITLSNPSGDALDDSIRLFEYVLPAATRPIPYCLLQMDLARLYFANGEPDAAYELVDDAFELCADRVEDSDIISELRGHSYRDALSGLRESLADGDLDEARSFAWELMRYESKNSEALQLITYKNLGESFKLGDVETNPGESPEPVDIRRFVMPQNGDWGDVIFTHPPAALSFALNLPEDPVALRSRVAQDPQSWGWGGDGVTFVASVRDGRGAVHELYRLHVPNDESGHNWHDVFVSLDEFAGQSVVLTLSTEVGPAGDGTGDWAGWETPRLIWQPDK